MLFKIIIKWAGPRSVLPAWWPRLHSVAGQSGTEHDVDDPQYGLDHTRSRAGVGGWARVINGQVICAGIILIRSGKASLRSSGLNRMLVETMSH